MQISHRARVGVVALVAMVGASISSAASADSGIVRISVVKGGWFLGANGGWGTLIFHGRRYPLSVGGVDAGLVFGSVADDLGWPGHQHSQAVGRRRSSMSQPGPAPRWGLAHG